MPLINAITTKVKYVIRSIQMCACSQDHRERQAFLADILRNQLLAATPKERLEHSELSVYSQNGEDGIIAEIFNRIGLKSKIFIEFGVGDGLQNNTRYLLQQSGWKGLWIEGSHENCQEISRNCALYLKSGKLVLKESFITKDNIDSLIASSFTGDIDLMSIDIDGNDLHIWKSIKSVSPRVLITEYNPSFPPPAEIIMPYKADHVWKMGTDYYGASLSAWNSQLNQDGYTLVGCDLSGTNAFWVRKDLIGANFSFDRSPALLFRPARHLLYIYLAHGHDTSPCEWQSAICNV